MPRPTWRWPRAAAPARCASWSAARLGGDELAGGVDMLTGRSPAKVARKHGIEPAPRPHAAGRRGDPGRGAGAAGRSLRGGARRPSRGPGRPAAVRAAGRLAGRHLGSQVAARGCDARPRSPTPTPSRPCAARRSVRRSRRRGCTARPRAAGLVQQAADVRRVGALGQLRALLDIEIEVGRQRLDRLHAAPVGAAEDPLDAKPASSPTSAAGLAAAAWSSSGRVCRRRPTRHAGRPGRAGSSTITARPAARASAPASRPRGRRRRATRRRSRWRSASIPAANSDCPPAPSASSRSTASATAASWWSPSTSWSVSLPR